MIGSRATHEQDLAKLDEARAENARLRRAATDEASLLKRALEGEQAIKRELRADTERLRRELQEVEARIGAVREYCENVRYENEELRVVCDEILEVLAGKQP